MTATHLRSVMEPGVPYIDPILGPCTFAWRGCEPTDDLVVVKEEWSNHPLGHLITRCPQHR